jgi:DNA-binding NtrC family response regulator
MQIQLLRFLDDGWFTPVGSTTPRHSNVRILAATHRDISRHVAAGLFREDFAYRLAVLVVEIPPLRERLEDIPELVAGFLVEQALRTGKVKRAGSRLLTSLMANPWPGNVRQLRSEIERLCVLSGEETELDPADYVPRLGPTACARMQPIPPGGIAPLVDDYARRLVLGAIARHPINVTAAARECGYSLQGFKGLCVRLGIPLALAGRSGARRARTLTHRGNSHPTFTSLVRSPAP